MPITTFSTLCLAYVANNGSNNLLFTTSPALSEWSSNITWSSSVAVMAGGQQSKAAPAASASGDLLAYIANNSSNDLLTGFSFEAPLAGNPWPASAVAITSQSSVTTPAIHEPLSNEAGLSGIDFVLAYVADNGSRDLISAVAVSNSNGSNIIWKNGSFIPGQSSATAPALAYFNNALVLAYVATNGSNDIVIARSTAIEGTSIVWGSGAPTSKTSPQSSKMAPALCVYNSELYLAYVAANGSNDLLFTKSSDGVNWSTSQPVTNQSSKFAPALALFPASNLLVLAYVANNGSNDLLVTAFNGETWTQSQTVTKQSSSAAPAFFIQSDTGNTTRK